MRFAPVLPAVEFHTCVLMGLMGCQHHWMQQLHGSGAAHMQSQMHDDTCRTQR